MAHFNSILPPEFTLSRGQAYKCYLSNTQMPIDETIKKVFFSLVPKTLFKDLSTIENNSSLSEDLATAIKSASTELSKFIRYVKEKCIKERKAIKDRKLIFNLSDYPGLQKDWKGVLLKQSSEEALPLYLKIFNDGQQDASFADVKMMSSDGVTFLLNRLFVASASPMLRGIFSDIIPVMDDDAVILVQTNVRSDELKAVVQIIMFGQIDCHEKCPNECKIEDVLELLKDFGINMTGNSVTFSHCKKSGDPKMETIQFDHHNEKHVTNDCTFNVKEESGLDDSFDEPQERAIHWSWPSSTSYISKLEQSLEFRGKDMLYHREDFLGSHTTMLETLPIQFNDVPHYTDVIADVDVEGIENLEMEKFLPSEDSFDSSESVESITNKRKSMRKRKLLSKSDSLTKKRKKKDSSILDKKKLKGSSKEQKPFLELSREGQKARVGEFFDRFLNESQILGISDGSFAGYLGYRATVDGEPWVASTFKWLHEGITSEERLKETENGVSTTSNTPENSGVIEAAASVEHQSSKVKPRPTFLDLTFEEKVSQVGDFFELFLNKANQLQISPACFAAYLGMKVTYVTDRLAASTFSKLYDGSDKREKWRFSAGPKEIKCVACGKRFHGEKMTFLSVRLKGHMKTVHPSFNFQCITCGEPVETWEDHVKHTNEAHAGEMKMQCNSCDLIFSSRAEIRSHKLTHHTTSRPEIVCSECGKKLTPASMEVHMKTEHGQEHIACPKCPKILKHPVALERHMKTNHDECQCEECGKVCNSATGLKRHILTSHTPDNLKVNYDLCNMLRVLIIKFLIYKIIIISIYFLSFLAVQMHSLFKRI